MKPAKVPKGIKKRYLEESISKRLEASVERDRLSRESVPDDANLQRVWSAWHSMPGDLTADERRFLLAGHPEAHRQTPGLDEALRTFPGYPFREAAVASLRAAWLWGRFIEDLHTARQGQSDLIAEFWAFGQADHAHAGRLPTFRAGLELDALDPEILKSTCPDVALITRVTARRAAYGDARADAHRRLVRALTDGLTRVPGRCHRRPSWSFAVQVDPDGECIRFFKESDLIARLESLSICSPGRLEQFLRTKLPGLPHSERQGFYKIALQTRRGNDRLLPLQVWLADNAPVIRQFRLRPVNLWEQANKRMIPNCSGPVELAKLRSRWKLPFRFEVGIPTAEVMQLGQLGMPLLSPAPQFGPLFQASAT